MGQPHRPTRLTRRTPRKRAEQHVTISESAARTIEYWRTFEARRQTRWVHFVYFIQEVDGGPVKIGRADNPVERLSELQCGNPRPLCIRHVILARWETETRLHEFWTDPKWLKEARIRGEWFGNGHEDDILAMGARIAERQIQAHRDGAELDEVRGKVVTRAMFANPAARKEAA